MTRGGAGGNGGLNRKKKAKTMDVVSDRSLAKSTRRGLSGSNAQVASFGTAELGRVRKHQERIRPLRHRVTGWSSHDGGPSRLGWVPKELGSAFYAGLDNIRARG